MVEENALANECSRMDFDASEPSREIRNKTGNPFETNIPASM
jgi:hypothetical protein